MAWINANLQSPTFTQYWYVKGGQRDESTGTFPIRLGQNGFKMELLNFRPSFPVILSSI